MRASGTEKLALLAAGAVALAVIWLASAVILFRFCVAALWGSGSPAGLVAAPLVLAGGLVGLAYLAVGMARLVRKKLKSIGDA